ncbi:hypothetical protein PQC39_gp141 [Vibrio phage Vp_R1]|uniref:Uncharacterized protein n=1 Tax=Vibrio phage Vp_R1 TaxID=2059867 RepID=A0A2H5BQB2_9CAUD|nr:hypothetical protein PQC39_gp141 [Vibrio phage Vp_R1]AUG88505.1 hypothetical protein VPR_141 [Vibrio phage Vp_R1]
MSTIPSNTSRKKTEYNYDIIPDGDYPARLVRFVGLGIQDQPDFQGQPKQPAFKASFAFELIGMDATGTIKKFDAAGELESEEAMEPKPSCQFGDYYLFPGAQRGKVFDLCKVLDPSITKVPGELSWFENQLDQIVSVTVGHYVVKNGPNKGRIRNTIRGISAVPGMFKSQVGPARSDQLFFEPYADTPQLFAAYSNLYGFQRTILSEAHDAANIPFAGKDPAENGVNGQNGEPESQPTSTGGSGNSAPQGGADYDDDMPF